MEITITAVLVLVLELITVFGFVLMERRQPLATLAWLLAVIFLPVLGMVLYLFLGITRSRRRKRLETVVARIQTVLTKHPHLGVKPHAEEMPYRTRALLGLGESLSGVTASLGNKARLLVNAATTYRAIIDAIQTARHHVHVEFYIIQPDQTGRNLRDRLTKRAKEGIEVRVLADALGSMALPSDFWDPLTEAGGRAAYFAPIRVRNRFKRRDRVDFRNHRKIVIVDGYIAFTGGINVGKEYLGMNPDLGHWRDTHMQLEGQSVLALQHTFAEDWLATVGELLDASEYYPEPQECPGDRSHSKSTHDDQDGCMVQIVDSGPDRNFSPIHQLYFSVINMAESRLWITSPYFVPDGAIQLALITAGLRGVDVRLLLPLKSDSLLVSVASRSYYRELLEAGVRIFEYERGFVHAKTIVVDDWVASVGSANMDIRSFHLNFEINGFVFDESFCNDLANTFIDDLRHSEEVNLASQLKLKYWQRLARSAARLMSPVL